MEEAFLKALHENPGDRATWLVLADWFEEQGDPRADLIRLHQQLRFASQRSRSRRASEAQLRALLQSGIRPCVPVWTNSIGMQFALIPAGTFMMGSRRGEAEHTDDERPRHEVVITRPFYLGVYPVTQAEYKHLIKRNPSHFRANGGGRNKVRNLNTERFPVECVSWNQAATYCRLLGELPAEKEADRVYRLPTEAEWEYACREAGACTATYHLGDTITSHLFNCDGQNPLPGADPGPYLGRTTEVGSYPPNALGLYDMHGNVCEWCQNWFDSDYYRNAPREDPTGPEHGDYRCIRGGSWDFYIENCRASYRNNRYPEDRDPRIGFRVLLECPREGEEDVG